MLLQGLLSYNYNYNNTLFIFLSKSFQNRGQPCCQFFAFIKSETSFLSSVISLAQRTRNHYLSSRVCSTNSPNSHLYFFIVQMQMPVMSIRNCFIIVQMFHLILDQFICPSITAHYTSPLLLTISFMHFAINTFGNFDFFK